MTVAALYVETNGVYYGLPDVDPWDEQRDARLYDGPWPVVAHPPCQRWSTIAHVVQAVHGYRVGDDEGTFEAALNAVRRFGGVLEHPAHSIAWRKFGLPVPSGRGTWTRTLLDDGWTAEVDQCAYGHEARKPTWLYAVTDELPGLLTGSGSPTKLVSYLGYVPGNPGTRLGHGQSKYTPPAFRDVLLDLARSAAPSTAGACGLR